MDASKAAQTLADNGWTGLVPVTDGSLGDLQHVEVLHRYRCVDIELCVAKDTNDSPHLVYQANDSYGAAYDVFIAAPISDEQLSALRNGTLPIRSVLTADIPSVRVVLEYLTADKRIAGHTFRPTDGLPDKMLPPSDEML